MIYFLAGALTLTVAVFLFAPQETFFRHDCDVLQGACVMRQGDIELSVKMTPTPIVANESVHYQVAVTGFEPDEAVIRLIGKSMHMEEDFISLTKVSDGHYEAKRNFPLCTEKMMVWQAVLLMRKQNHYVRTFFDLKVKIP